MKRRKPVEPGEEVHLRLTEDERDLICGSVTVEVELEQRLRATAVKDGQVDLALTFEELDELADCIAFEANHAGDWEGQQRWDRLYERVADLLDAYGEQEGLEDYLGLLLEEAMNRVVPGTENLSVLQLSRLIFSDWDDPTGILHLNEELALAELQGAPILVNARIFLEAVQRAEGVKATAAGNLTRKFVAEMMAALHLPPDYVADIRRYNKVINEEDVFRLHVLRLIVQLSGLLRRAKGVFKVTKKCSKLLGEDQAGGLYALLFWTYFNKFNIAYADHLPELPLLQHTIAFSLFMLSRHAGDWRTVEDLAPLLFLPAVEELIAELPYGDSTSWVAHSRVIEPLEAFGLLERRELPTEQEFVERVEVRKTELYDAFLSFDLGPSLRLV